MPLTNITPDAARIAVAGLAVPNLAVIASDTVTADYTITAIGIANGSDLRPIDYAQGIDPQVAVC